MDDALRITNSGLTLTATSSVLSGVAIPNNGNAEATRYLRGMCESGFGYVKLGTAAQSTTLVATFADVLLTANESAVFHTRGLTHISVITRSGTTIMNFVPVEE